MMSMSMVVSHTINNTAKERDRERERVLDRDRLCVREQQTLATNNSGNTVSGNQIQPRSKETSEQVTIDQSIYGCCCVAVVVGVFLSVDCCCCTNHLAAIYHCQMVKK